MSGKAPLFSIVLPTRNRAHLLKYALQTALEQTFHDFEVVVSNNCSSDDTANIVKRFGDSRVRYFETDRVLTMPDSWEFALGMARGEWVTYLCDDDAISSVLLETLASTIRETGSSLLTWEDARYNHPTWYDVTKRNQLVVSPFTYQRQEFDSRFKLAELFQLRDTSDMPKMLNSCCHREVINTVKRRLNRFYLPSCPDYTACAALLAVVGKYTYIDLPLRLAGMSKDSIGVSCVGRREHAFLAWVAEFGGQGVFRHVPLRVLVVHNFIADSVLVVQKAMQGALDDLHLDWTQYFLRCYDEMLALKNHGVDISEESEDFFTVLSHHQFSVRTTVYRYVLMRKVRTAVRALIQRSQHLANLESRLRPQGKVPLILEGDEVGFKNIYEALQYLEHHVIKPRNQYA